MKRVLIVGAGALGSWTSEIMARSEPLSFTLVDFDKVDKDNIYRQLYYPKDVGRYKVDVLGERLESLGAEVERIRARIEDVIDELDNFDLALALTDNIESRLVVERKFKTLHAMVRPEVGLLMMTSENVKLKNVMRRGRHVGRQDVSMVVTVSSFAARFALEYLRRGKSELEGKLMVISPTEIEWIDLL